MSFEEPSNPNVRPNPFTQDIGRPVDVKSFKQQPLLKNEHEDPDLHLIGQGLPAPSNTEAQLVGRTTSVGESPFPARADHTHDLDPRFSLYYKDITCGPGLTFISGWNQIEGDNILAPASTQIFLYPTDGVWQTTGMCYINGAGGANMTGQFEFREYFFNGTYIRYPWSSKTAGVTTQTGLCFSWVSNFHTYTFDSANNVQFAYLQNDVINHTLHFEFLQFVRLGRYI